ncbi:MAG: hydantoinase/oxoprolinase family protein [Chloroflexota bacterium]
MTTTRARASYRLGVDIGGTFTDGVLIDEDSGAIEIDKILTTPDDPSLAFLSVASRLAERLDIEPAQIRYIMHAMTTATNAVIERRGAQAGLLVTAGFRDILEIQRQVRHELYNLQTDKPPPLVRRRHCLEIPERLDYRGEVVVDLDVEAVADAVERLKSEDIHSIAVCYLHAYRNPTHEQRTAEVIRRVHPGATISLSSDVAPEIREYWRASTTVVNAYIAPVVARYLSNIEKRLEQAAFCPDVHVMQSNGGVTSAKQARRRPIALIESGPAAGVRAAAFVAGRMGYRDAISFDMGGTTAKMGLVREGQPRVLQEFEVGAGSFSGTGLVKGSGYPILAAVVDLVEVGAGGGSLGWVDAGGLLRVGPRSAGAEPGPACYGRGGEEPTITDANLALGRLNPDYFLGGQLRLDADAAHRALESRCAEPLGISGLEVAMGIVDIANATMGQAMRLVTVQRGHDPGDFCMVAFGGAGPAHANALAAALGIPVVLVPPSPGVASALGMLVSDLRHDYHATYLKPLAAAQPAELDGIFQEFAASAMETLAAEGVRAERVRLDRFLEIRYVGQSWKLSVPLEPGDLNSPAALQRVKHSFDSLHETTYGYSAPDERAEIVNVGMLATGLMPRVELRPVPVGDSSSTAARRGSRRVYFSETSGFADATVLDRYALRVGNVIEGPAVIEEVDSTTVVHPGYSAEVGVFGVLVLRQAQGAG